MTMHDATIIAEIAAVDWSQYETAYGAASGVPAQLTALAFGDAETTMRASHDLWCGLCHQHVHVSSAALPAMPIIAAMLDRSADALTVEILDILYGFAICTSPAHHGFSAGDWQYRLREGLFGHQAVIAGLLQHADADIRWFAAGILDDLALGM